MSDRLPRVRLILFVAVLLALAAVAFYTLHVQQRKRYLVELSFRRLASMGQRIDDQLNLYRQAVESLMRNSDYSLAQYRKALPFDVVSAGMVRMISREPLPSTGVTVIENRVERGVNYFYFTYNGPGKLVARHPVASLVAPALETEGFDKLLFVSSAGRILFQTGRSDVGLTSLAGLETAGGKALEVAGLSHASRLIEVRISGERYQLFVQPLRAVHDEQTDLNKGGSGGWMLCGLVRADRLQREAFEISPIPLIFFFSLLLLAALTWPFLRLVTIGAGERLRAIDGLLVTLSALIGVSALVLLALDGIVYARLSAMEDRQLQVLTTGLVEQFRADLARSLRRAEALNRQAMGEPVRPDEAVPLRASLLDKASCLLPEGFAFPAYFWVDETGDQLLKWQVPRRETPLGSVRDKSYFKDALAGRLLTHSLQTKGKGHALCQFTMERVQGWRPDDWLVQIGMPLQGCSGGGPAAAIEKPVAVPSCLDPAVLDGARRKARLAVLSTRMPSLSQPVLPPGFGFAVIDREGRVIFHSDAKRSLQENFLEEIDSQLLRSLLSAERSDLVKAQYGGKTVHAYPVAIQGIPWSIVGFRDLGLLRTANVEILTTALVCLIFYAVVFALVLSVVYLLPAFRARWIWPSLRYETTYFQLTCSYVFLLALYGYSLGSYDGFLLFWGGVVMPLVVMAITYLKIHWDRLRREARDRQDPHGELPFETQHYVVLGLMVLLLLSLLGITLQNADWLQGLPVALGIVLIAVFLFTPPIERMFSRRLHMWSLSAYSLSALLLLTILTVPPAISFFKLAYDLPVENLIKYNQLKLLEEAERLRAVPPGHANRAAVFSSRVDLVPESAPACGQDPAEQPLHSTRLSRLVEALLPFYNEASTEMARLGSDQERNRYWQWVHCKGGKLVLVRSAFGGGKKIRLESVIPYLTLDLIDWRGAVVALLGILAVVVLIIRFVSRNLLLLRLSLPVWLERAPERLARVDGPLGCDLIYVSRHRERLKIPARGDALVIDLSVHENEVEAGTVLDYLNLAGRAVVFVDRFEHRLKDPVFNEAKRRLLEDLLQDSGRRLVVLSSWDPHFCLMEGTLAGPGSTPKEMRDHRRRWLRLLGRFETFDLDGPGDRPAFEKRLQELAAKLEEEPAAGVRDTAGWRRHVRSCVRVIEEECGVTAPLQAIGLEMLADLSLDRLGPDQIREEIRDRADAYYRGLWASLAASERVVLVQLAEEGLVNAKSLRSLQRLIVRGLVRLTPAPMLMNRTFRRFVMSGYCRARVRELERRSEETSAWGRLRKPMVAVFWGAAVFFFVTQKEVFDSSLLFLSATAGALPHLLELVGYFGAAKTKAEAEG